MNYKEIADAVTELAENEKNDIIKEHGAYVDLNHAYGVIIEEFDEMSEWVDRLSVFLDVFRHRLMRSKHPIDQANIIELKKAAREMCAEAIQVYATILKLEDM